jgi:hypothetical protein
MVDSSPGVPGCTDLCVRIEVTGPRNVAAAGILTMFDGGEQE